MGTCACRRSALQRRRGDALFAAGGNETRSLHFHLGFRLPVVPSSPGVPISRHPSEASLRKWNHFHSSPPLPLLENRLGGGGSESRRISTFRILSAPSDFKKRWRCSRDHGNSSLLSDHSSGGRVIRNSITRPLTSSSSSFALHYLLKDQKKKNTGR